MRKLYPIFWLLFAAAILALDYATGALVFLAPLLFFPIALASWFNGKLWGLSLAITTPLVRLGFRMIWTSPTTPVEAISNAVVLIVTFSTFAVLIDLVIRQRSEIRVLKGFLPTCAWCKQIRDEAGQWYQMETYIAKHSDAKFSHGICPECAVKNFGESIE